MTGEYEEVVARFAKLTDDEGRVTIVARITHKDGHHYYGVGTDTKTAIEAAFVEMQPDTKRFEYHDQVLWSPELKKLLDSIGEEEYDSLKTEQRKTT